MPAGRYGARERCHAIRFRLAAGGDIRSMQDALGAMAGRLGWPARAARLWADDVPAPADSALAARRVRTELRRPLAPERGAPLRAVLLTYRDGPGDLVLIGDRHLLDLCSLRLVAAAMLGEDATADRLTAGRPVALPAVAPPRMPPSWGLGGHDSPGKGDWFGLDLPVTGRTRPADLVVAVALALARYDGLALEGTVGTLRQAAEESIASGRIPDGRGGLSPLAGVLIESVPSGTEDLGPKPAEWLPALAPPYPLTVAAGPSDVVLMFRAAFFARPVGERFAKSVRHVCAQLGRAGPDTALAEIRLHDREEVRRIARLGGVGALARPRAERIEQAFAAMAAKRPEAPALCLGDREVTYGELDRSANRVAHALRSLGVRAGDRVGICLDRSVTLVTVMLAALKAGAAYVPMDLSYPAGRLTYTVVDARPSVVVTSADGLRDGGSARVVSPDELARVAAAEPDVSPTAAGTPTDPAYVIYTSGSTGRPKGVVVPHRNLMCLIASAAEDLAPSPEDTWTLFHSSAFDFSVWEIWGCLLTGGRLVVVPYDVSRSPEDFHALLARERVTVLNQTPSAFAQLLRVDRDKDVDLPLRLVVFGGEALDTRILLPWFERHPPTRCRLVNMYGITETTVHVTAETVSRAAALSGSRSVGRPLAGWHVYVLDRDGHLAPPGVVGEIFVGGAGVALHYLNRPDLTAERFLPDPYVPGVMYRSGDRGRLLADGRLEYFGRQDDQVKLRGFRIELDEIRMALLDDPLVAEAVVVLDQSDPGDPATGRLDAYVVPAGETSRFGAAGVRERTARILPDHMVPATVTVVPALPLTPNGKVDRAALPEPSLGGVRARPASPGPVGGLVAELVEVWQKILGVSVDPDDSFFALGGNSLHYIKIAAAMRERGLNAPAVRDLYQNPTVRRLAAVLENRKA